MHVTCDPKKVIRISSTSGTTGSPSFTGYTQKDREAVNETGSTAPIVTSGGIGTFELAEGILQRGEADIVAAARASLADPDWFLKTYLGRGEDVRRCEFTNYCEALDQKHKKVTCKLWDRIGVDRGERRLVAPEWEL